MIEDPAVRAELSTKCDAFLDELGAWRAKIPDLPQHKSQLERLAGILVPLGERVKKRIESDDHGAVDHWQASAEVLLLFRIWAFYRDKLSQRFVPWQKEVLEVADELAYSFWRPAQQAAVDAKKTARDKAGVAREPPLVFLNGDVSPFALTRAARDAFTVEQVEVGLDATRVAWAQRVLDALPVPAVGMPYFSGRFVPELLLLAHEVGHHVEDDFDLTEDLERAVRSALQGEPRARRDDWLAWTGETFADVWGVLVGGPAFVDAMSAFAISLGRDLESERPAPGAKYPTVLLRAEVLFATLEELGLVKEAASRRASLRARFAKNTLAEYEPSCRTVARALLGCSPAAFGGRSVREASGAVKKTLEATLVAGRSIADGQAPAANASTTALAQAISVAFALEPTKVSKPSRLALLLAALQASVKKGARSIDPSRLDKAAADQADGDLIQSLLPGSPGASDPPPAGG